MYAQEVSSDLRDVGFEVSSSKFGGGEDLVQGVGSEATHSCTPTGDLGLIIAISSADPTSSSFPLIFMCRSINYKEKGKVKMY